MILAKLEAAILEEMKERLREKNHSMFIFVPAILFLLSALLTLDYFALMSSMLPLKAGLIVVVATSIALLLLHILAKLIVDRRKLVKEIREYQETTHST